MKQEARELIYRQIGDALSGANFRLNRRMEGFIRVIPGGWQEIGVPFYDYNPRFDFSLVMSIRLDEVENIVNLFSGAPSKHQTDTVTTVIQLENFMDGSTRFSVTSPEGIQNTVGQLTPVIMKKILPFFDEYKDVAMLNRALNLGPKSIDTSYHPYRGMSAIVVAKLAGNADFEKLVERYLAEMSSIPPQDKDKFVRLAQHLREQPEMMQCPV